MRILVTGAMGFVAPYVAIAIRRVFGDVEIIGTSKDGGTATEFGQIETLDVTDSAAVQRAITTHQPSHVVHLAAISAPVSAAGAPLQAWEVNLGGTLNIARAIIDTSPDCWLMNVGSGMVYGRSLESGEPADEGTVLAPIDEYAATKAAADMALGALTSRGLRCIRMRPFNHTGPGQLGNFVVPSFAMQIARIEIGLQPPVISVGNLDTSRDWLDVRDVADAYVLALKNAAALGGSPILNVASGIGTRIGDILNLLLSMSSQPIKVHQDPKRLRASDLPVIVGDATRARQALGWRPQHDLTTTLRAVLDDCRAGARAGRKT